MNGWQLYALIVFLQATVTSALALVAMRCFQRNAAARHTIGSTALIFLALIPALTAVLPRAWFTMAPDEPPAPAVVAANLPHELPVEPPTNFVPAPLPRYVPAEVAMPSLPLPNVAEPPRAVEPIALPNPPPQEIAAAPAPAIKRNWLALGGNLAALLWGMGVVWLTSRAIRRGGQLRQLIKCAQPYSLSEQLLADVRAAFPAAKLPVIVVSDQLSVPCVLGCWQPRVVLPRHLVEAGTSAQLRQVLIHESAHIVRGDPWVNMLQLIVGIFYWPQLAVSWLNRELARAREEVVDNHVLQCCDSADYAQTLLDLAEQASGPTWKLIPLGLFGRWTLEERIAGLLNNRREKLTHASRRLLVGVVLLFGGISFVLGGAAAREQVPVPIEVPAKVTEPVKVADPPKAVAEKPAPQGEKPWVMPVVCRDENGKPISGARVRLFRVPFLLDNNLALYADELTDTEGKVTFRSASLANDPKKLTHAAAWMTLVTTAKGYTSTEAFLVTDELLNKEANCVLNSKPATLSGVIKDEAGHPITGAEIFIPVSNRMAVPGYKSSVTDEKGKFSITDLKPWNDTAEKQDGGYWTFELRHPGYANNSGIFTAVPQEVNVTLPSPGFVEGRVIDAGSGEPLPRVTVNAFSIAVKGGTKRIVYGDSVNTDAEGRYRLKLNPAEYKIWIDADDRIQLGLKKLKLQKGQNKTGVDIPTSRGGFVTGQVLDATGVPLKNADQFRVSHYGPAWPRNFHFEAYSLQADGTFRFRVAPGKNYVYLQNGPDAASAIAEVAEGGETKVDLRIGTEAPHFEAYDWLSAVSMLLDTAAAKLLKQTPEKTNPAAAPVQLPDKGAVPERPETQPPPEQKDVPPAMNPAAPPATSDHIPTIGDDDVEPIEITGQVLDVDGKPAAKSSVRISGLFEGSPRKWSVESPADQEGRFHFRVRSKSSFYKYKISATNSDNSQLGFHRFPYRGNYPELAKNVVLKLSPSRVVRLKVVDKAGTPIENARTAMFFEGYITSDVIPSDAAGIASFTIPANERIRMALAWKDNSGLEYRYFDERPFAVDGNETLILEGAAPVAFKIVDDNGMPVKNMEVYPWHLQSKSQDVMFNPSLINRAFIANTDEQGIVKFAWFPTWQTATEFWLKAPGFTDQRVVYTPGKDGGQKEFVVPKNVPVRGHVRDADGKPVAGVKVQADGAGHIADRGYATAVTDKDGAYELWVLPNQIYLVTATAPGLAAAPQTGFAVLPGQPVEGKDFTLRKATRIFGRLLDQTTQEPLKNQSLVLAQQGTGLRFNKDVKLPNPYDTRWDVTPTKYYYTFTDTQGRFELFVGDGDYVYPQQKQNFHIAGEAEREFTLKVDLEQKRIFFMGVVREKATNQRLSMATITSRSKDGSASGEFEENTTREGDFSAKRMPTAAYLHAVSKDKNLKTILEINAQQPRAVLYLEPVGTIRGRLLKPDTKEPWSRKWVQFAAVLPNSTEKGSTQYYAGWGGEVLTGEDGKFEKIWLVPNWKYRMELKDDFTAPGIFLGEVTVSPGETKNLGDVTPPPIPKPNPPAPPKPEPAAPKADPKPEVGKTESTPAAPAVAATTGKLPVVCRDEKGNAVPGARVRLYQMSVIPLSFTLLKEETTDRNGKVTLTNIQPAFDKENRIVPEDLLLSITARGYASTGTQLDSTALPTKEMACVLNSNPGSLSGIVIDEAGQPIKGVKVTLPSYGEKTIFDIETVTDDSGKFQFTDLRRWNSENSSSYDPKTGLTAVRGPSSFHLSHPDFALSTGQYTAVPQEVSVTLRKPAIVEGRVIDAVTGKPLPNAPVIAQVIDRGMPENPESQIKTDAAGRYRLKLNGGYYNIWAEVPERMPIAVKALPVNLGQTTSGVDISMMRGGVVSGRVIDDKAVIPPKLIQHLRVAHQGPARPQSGAAVTTANLQADGTFRLLVAPGKNYVYLMNDTASAMVDVLDGGETKIELRLGQKVPQSEIDNDPDVLHAARIQELHRAHALSGTKNADMPKLIPTLRKYSETRTGRLLEKLEGQSASNSGWMTDESLKTLKEIVDFGPAAVPELCVELELTQSNSMLRYIPFMLRAIGDKRAVPALIRTIPRTFIKPGSDLGLQAKDPELLKFAQEHDLDPKNRENGYGLGRPVREVFGALQKLTGQQFFEQELYGIFLSGTESQQQAKRAFYHKTAKTWADWWEQHAREFVQDPDYFQVKLPELSTATEKATDNSRLKIADGGGSSGNVLESIHAAKAKQTFFDLDTGRRGSLPKKWRDAKNVEDHLDKIIAWAAGEGYDLMGTEFTDAAGDKHFALRGIELKAWELSPTLWKKIPKDKTPEELKREGTPVDGLILHYDKTKKAIDPKAHAPFLIITREGTPMILNVGVQVQEAKDITGQPSMGDSDLNPVSFRQGRRFGLQEFTEQK